MPAAEDDHAPLARMQREFRQHLETFYRRLELASPYHSVEKAIAQLTAALKSLPTEERVRIAGDERLRWQQYTAAFAASGLAQKHRGIILGVIRAGRAPSDYRPWLDLYLPASDTSGESSPRNS